MADAAITLQASNLFSLHANFKTSASGTGDTTTNVLVMDESGNVACEQNIADITNYTQSAGYCGSDFVADFGTFLTTFGEVQNSKAVTGITINMTAGEYCTVDIEGHNHANNAHTSLSYADVSDFLPHEVAEAFNAWDGFGVPDFGIVVGAAASPISATVTFNMNHVDQVDESGDHLVGTNITPRCELSMDFSGIPTSQTISALETDMAANTNSMLTPLVDSFDSNDSNSDFDSFAFAAHAHSNIV